MNLCPRPLPLAVILDYGAYDKFDERYIENDTDGDFCGIAS